MGFVDGSKATGGKHYSQSDGLKGWVKDRDNRTCQICGATEADGARLEVDHIIPFAVSHDSTLSNLRALCIPCNRATRRKRRDASLPEREYYQWVRGELDMPQVRA